MKGPVLRPKRRAFSFVLRRDGAGQRTSAFDPLRTLATWFSIGAVKALSCIALWMLVALPQPLAAAKPARLEGMPYAKARSLILSYGWRPVSGSCGGASNDTCENFPEVGNCSGTGLGFCDMSFARRNRCLVVVTVGGEPRIRNRREPTVRDLQFRTRPCSKD